MNVLKTMAAASLLLVVYAPVTVAQDHAMSFFVTSTGMGNGADLGGLAGADAHCAKLAEAAGSTGRTWRAYLSTQVEGKRGISARDRIGPGPWHNARGELIASDLDQLHINPNIFARTALDEKGNGVKGRGDKPNEHDMLTGTKAVLVTTPARTGPVPGKATQRSDIMTGTVAAIRRGTPPMNRAAAARKT